MPLPSFPMQRQNFSGTENSNIFSPFISAQISFRAAVFTKIGRELAVAAKGNPNPDTNSKLADVYMKHIRFAPFVRRIYPLRNEYHRQYGLRYQ